MSFSADFFRFLADTLQPMLKIQGLRLILPQAPEEALAQRDLLVPMFVGFLSRVGPRCLTFPDVSKLSKNLLGLQVLEETLQNQKLQSWFLPINGQWIIDDRVLI